MTIRKVARGAPDPNSNGAAEFVKAFQVFRGLRDARDANEQDYELNKEKNAQAARKAMMDESSSGFTSSPDGRQVIDQNFYDPTTPEYKRAAQKSLFDHPPQTKGGGALLTAGQYNRLRQGLPKGQIDDDLKDLPLSPSYGFGNQKALEPGADDEMLRGIVEGRPLPGNPQIPKAAIPLYRRNPNEAPIDPAQQAAIESAWGTKPGTAKNLRVGNFATGMNQITSQREQNTRQDKALNNASAIAQAKIDEKKRIAAEKQAKADEEAAQTAGIVTEDIGRALEAAKASPYAVGPFVGQTYRIPGTPAYNLNNLLETIKANIAFDKLQKMRAASPTGGALGNVSDFENKMLQGTAGKLDVTMNQEDFEKNMNRLLQQYDAVINRGVEPGDELDDASNESDKRAARTQGGKRNAYLDPAIQAVIKNPAGADSATNAAAKAKLDQIAGSSGVRVKNLATGKVGTIPQAKLDAALKSGKFQKVE